MGIKRQVFCFEMPQWLHFRLLIVSENKQETRAISRQTTENVNFCNSKKHLHNLTVTEEKS